MTAAVAAAAAGSGRLARRRVWDALEVLAAAAAPREQLTVSQWADRHRELTSKQSGERGRYRTDRTPYWREFMDEFSAHSRVRESVLVKGSQEGATEAMINVLGYVMHHAPAPAMVLMPTLELRDAWKAQKLNPLLTDTPAVRDLLGGLRARDAANRQDMIDFPGGILFLAGGNSPNSYRQRSAALVIMDDVDGFAAVVGNEGDPLALGRNRNKTFPRGKFLAASSPTDEGSLIWAAYLDSDMRQYHVPCPLCGHLQPLHFSEHHCVAPWSGGRIVFDERIDQAWYECAACKGAIAHAHKPRMLAAGRWVAAHPERRVRGRHLSALYAAVGLGPTWADLAREYETARRSPTTLQTFVNHQLGLPFSTAAEELDLAALMARCEEFADPLPAREERTCGVDVQKNRLEVSLIDWTAGETAWVQDHLILPGDTAQEQVWRDLAELFDTLAPDKCAIDLGFNAEAVRAFLQGRPWAYGVLGRDGAHRPLVEDERTRRQRLRKKFKNAGDEVVGVEVAKQLIQSRVAMRPADRDKPGFVHFSARFATDDEYFAQLAAERRVLKARGLKMVWVWEQTRPRNEALDCFVYALAARRLPRRQTAATSRRIISRGRFA